jgi:integral membrane protein (TIGR01906 family)
MTLLDRFARFTVVVAMPVVLLLAPLYLFVTKAYVRHEYAQRGFPSSMRFQPAERLAISDAIVDYLRGGLTRQELAAVRTSAGGEALNTREVDHLVDVRVVVERLFRAHAVATVATLAAAVTLWLRRQRAGLARSLRHGVVATGALIAGVVGFSLVDFDAFFTAFHGLFFRAGTWTFEFTDTLIQLYPLPLWMDAVWKIGVAVAVEMVLVYALGSWLARKPTAVAATAPSEAS